MKQKIIMEIQGVEVFTIYSTYPLVHSMNPPKRKNNAIICIKIRTIECDEIAEEGIPRRKNKSSKIIIFVISLLF